MVDVDLSVRLNLSEVVVDWLADLAVAYMALLKLMLKNVVALVVVV